MTSPPCNDLDLQESHGSDVTDLDELYLSDESDDFLSEEEDEIAATKLKVDETVRRFVTGLKDFNELLSEIEHIVGSNELSQRDRSDIEKSYVDLCISYFHDKLIVWLRNDLSDSVKESLNDFLRSAQNVLDFERYFDSDVVPHCRLVVQCKKQGLMKPCDETPLIHKTVNDHIEQVNGTLLEQVPYECYTLAKTYGILEWYEKKLKFWQKEKEFQQLIKKEKAIAGQFRTAHY